MYTNSCRNAGPFFENLYYSAGQKCLPFCGTGRSSTWSQKYAIGPYPDAVIYIHNFSAQKAKKGKVIPVLNYVIKHHATEAYISSTVLYLSTRWRQWSASRPCRFSPRDTAPPYPLDRRLAGLHRGLNCTEKRKISCPCEKSDPSRPTRSLVGTPWSTYDSKINCINLPSMPRYQMTSSPQVPTNILYASLVVLFRL
jgi:hypothetical protein